MEVLQTELRRVCSTQEEQTMVVKELSETIVKKEKSAEKVETKMAVYERQRQFQLGRLNRSTLFEEFSNHAKSVLDGRSFSGNIKGQPVKVCICVLSATEEALLVARRCKDNAYMLWQCPVGGLYYFRTSLAILGTDPEWNTRGATLRFDGRRA